jgi:hypothetical protein
MADAEIPPVVHIWDAEDVDEILARFPGPLSISESRFAWSDRSRLMGRLGCGFGLTLFLIPCAILAINAIFTGNWVLGVFASALVLLFGLGLFANLLRARTPLYLVLDQDGFAIRNRRIIQRCKWADVRDFRLAGVIRYPCIRFKNTSPSARTRVLVGLGEDWLRFLIPYRDAALAYLMNEWRERALLASAISEPKA